LVNVFGIRDNPISDYASFVTSCINVHDPQIKERVECDLTEGVLWLDLLVQLNPSFVYGNSIDALVDSKPHIKARWRSTCAGWRNTESKKAKRPR